MPGSIAQDKTGTLADTTKKEPEIIQLADISVRSGELVIETKKMMESVITDYEIKSIAENNDSLIRITDSLLGVERTINLEGKNIRYLNNKLVYWKQIEGLIEQDKSRLAGIVKELDEEIYILEDEIVLWNRTKKAITEEDPSSGVFTRIDDLVFMMDSVKVRLQGKSNEVLQVLDRTTLKGLTINDLTNNIIKIKEEKEGELFVANQLPLWEQDFTDVTKWGISAPLRQFYKMEVKGLQAYFKGHGSNTVFYIFLLMFFIVAFLMMKKRILKTEINKKFYYGQILVHIVSHPISAALILGLFATVAVFPNLPLLFRDLTRLIVSFPLIIMVISLTEKKYNYYFYVLLLLIILQMFYLVFPPGHHLYAFSLLAIALVEIVTLWKLLTYFQSNPLSRKFLDRLVIIILFIHILISLAGLVGVVSGAVILAEVTLNLPIINAFAGILLVISALIINGLIEFGIESHSFQKLNVFRNYGAYIKRSAIRLINLSLAIFWIFTVLRVIKINRKVTEAISAFLTDEINIGSASFTFGGILIFFLVIWLSMVISKIIRAILEEDVLNHFQLAKGVPHTISVMVRYTLVTIGVFLAVSAAGMPLDSLTILFGAFGVGIGFGLQNIFNNLVSGLILLFERPIQIGDTIEVGTLMGNVKSIGIRSSNLRTFDGAEVIVPNGHLIANEVVNWTLSDQTRRIEVLAGVAYGSDPYKVKELFEKVLAEHPDIIKEPAPKVFFNDLGESSLDFRLLFWTSNFSEWIRIRSDIIFKVHDILKAEGIEIPFPQRDLHLRSVDDRINFTRKGEKD